MKLSKPTAAAAKAVADHREQIESLSPQIEAAKHDLKTPVDTLAAKIGTLSAKRDILAGRLELCRDELALALVDDVAKAHESAQAAAKIADETYRSERKTWMETCRQHLPQISASAFTSNKNAAPQNVRDLHKVAIAARDQVGQLEKARLSIDNDYRLAVMAAAREIMIGNTVRIESPELSRDVIVAAAERIANELMT